MQSSHLSVSYASLGWSRVIFMVLVGLSLSLQGCAIPYLVVQGRYQLKLLAGREPIEEVLEAGSMDPEALRALRLIQDVRRFAITELKMPDTGTYSAINPTFTHPIFNVSGAQPLAFEPYTWYFPIVGRIPYKGFFKEAHAQRAADDLRGKGLDVVMREVAGYSTLGYFEDPVLPSMLDFDDVALVDLIVHELAHGVFYFKGQVPFNESFANVVAHLGAAAYFESVDGPGSPRAQEAEDRHHDRDLHVQHLLALASELEAVYQDVALSDPEKTDAKAALIAGARAAYTQIPFRSRAYDGRTLPALGNAHLMSYRRYNSRPELFEALLREKGGDWGAFYDALLTLKGSDAPFEALSGLLLAEGAAPAP